MKIAVVTDDQTTISRHFGRARYYLVFTIEDSQVTQQEVRSKLGHDQLHDEEHHEHHEHHEEHHAHDRPHHRGQQGRHGYGRRAQDKHRRMMVAIGDCQVLLSAGMGMGAYESLQRMGITPILTDMKDIRAAVQAYLDGTLEDHQERLH